MRSTAYDRQRQINDLLAKIDSTWVSPRVLAKPTSAAVSIGSVCDLKCVFCSRQHFLPVDSAFMDFEQFQKLAPNLIGTRKASLFGLGDPLLNRRFIDFLRISHQYGIEATTTTHGMHLTEPVAQALIEEGMEELAVSLDAADPDLLQQLRANSDIERIFANLRRLADLKKQSGSKFPSLILTCTTSELNMAQMPALVQWAHDAGAEIVCFSDMIAIKPEFIRHTIRERGQFKGYYAQAKALAEKLGLTVGHFPQKSQPWKYNAIPTEGLRHGCSMAWEGFFVERLGETRPCCYLATSESNAFAETLEQSQHSPDKMLLRRQLMEGQIRTECRGCTSLSPNSRERVEEILADVERQVSAADFLEAPEREHLLGLVQQYRRLAVEVFPPFEPHDLPLNPVRRLARAIVPQPVRYAARKALDRIY